MVPPAMRGAANDEITVAMAGCDFPGLWVFFACGDNFQSLKFNSLTFLIYGTELSVRSLTGKS